VKLLSWTVIITRNCIQLRLRVGCDAFTSIKQIIITLLSLKQYQQTTKDWVLVIYDLKNDVEPLQSRILTV
jgi:multisubunit Na+/H+ antiporter MnhF subunit